MNSWRRSFALFLLLCVAAFAQDNLKFGQPACSGRLLDKTFFVICHSPENKIPIWVGYALTREDLAEARAGRTQNFRPDPDLPAGERAELADYAGSGFDRGHMAPAGDFKRSREAMSTTFSLSNMAPQQPRLNRGRWALLEGAVRDLANAHGKVWIFTGPAFAGNRPIDTIGPDEVAVPSHFFKVVLCVHSDDSKEMFAFVMPNTNRTSSDLSTFAQTVRVVEGLTGLDFFSALPRAAQDRLEQTANTLPIQ